MKFPYNFLCNQELLLQNFNYIRIQIWLSCMQNLTNKTVIMCVCFFFFVFFFIWVMIISYTLSQPNEVGAAKFPRETTSPSASTPCLSHMHSLGSNQNGYCSVAAMCLIKFCFSSTRPMFCFCFTHCLFHLRFYSPVNTIMRKPVFAICEQQWRRWVCASMQSD